MTRTEMKNLIEKNQPTNTGSLIDLLQSNGLQLDPEPPSKSRAEEFAERMIGVGCSGPYIADLKKFSGDGILILDSRGIDDIRSRVTAWLELFAKKSSEAGAKPKPTPEPTTGDYGREMAEKAVIASGYGSSCFINSLDAIRGRRIEFDAKTIREIVAGWINLAYEDGRRVERERCHGIAKGYLKPSEGNRSAQFYCASIAEAINATPEK